MNALGKNIKRYQLPILIALTSKILILFFIKKLSVYIIPNAGTINLSVWNLWNVWDAPHYVSIASSGYQKLGDEANFIAFLPLLPVLIFVSKFIFQTSYLIAGYIVSFFTSLLLSIMLYKLTLLDYPKKTAILAVIMLFIFPTAFFLHIPYTESLFILLSVAAFYSIRKKNYWVSFLFVGLATATKVAGLALIPAIFAEILFFDRQYFRKVSIYKKLGISLIGLVVSLSGFLIYLTLNYFLFGNFFYFTIVREQNWFVTFSPFGKGLIGVFQSLSWRMGLDRIMLGYAQIIAFFLGLIMSVYALVKIRFSYGIFMIIVLWLSFSMSFWLGMPRFILSLFPMYIILALFSNNIIFKYTWILLSITLLIFFSVIFIQWGAVL